MDLSPGKRAFIWSAVTIWMLNVSILDAERSDQFSDTEENYHQLDFLGHQPSSTEARRKRAADDSEDDTFESDEFRLIGKLLSRSSPHKKLARPVRNSTTTVQVNFGLDLHQILDFDEKEQVLQTRIWKEYLWKNEFLVWDPLDYGNITEVNMPRDAIWTPDVVLWNNVGARADEEHKELVVVSYDGSITWVPPVNYKSSCEVDMTYYPFDVQKCVLKFGSWTYNVKKLELQLLRGLQGMNLANYVPNAEWDLTENTVDLNLLYYSCCKEPFADLTFRLTLQRKVTFQIKLMILPTLLLSTISLFMFWIPAHRPDRTALGMSLFSSFFLLLILIFNTSPSTSTAKIGHFFSVVILLVTLGIMLSVFIINLSQSVRPMPKLLEMITVGTLGRFLCPGEFKHQMPVEAESTISDNSPTKSKQGDTNCFYSPIRSEKYKTRDPEANKTKWKILGVVLDRFFFLFYFFTLLFAYIFIFPKPHKFVHLM